MAAQNWVSISLIFSVTLGTVSGLSLTASPSNGMDVTTTTLDLQCVVDNALIPNDDIFVVQLKKDTQHIISFLVPSNKIKYANDIDPQQVEAKWNSLDSPGQSYLNFTFLYPTEEDAGTYICDIYFDKNGNVAQESHTALVTWNEMELSRMGEFVGDLLKKFHYLEEQLPLLDKKTGRGLKDIVGSLVAQTDKHSQELTSLSERDSRITLSLDFLGTSNMSYSKSLGEIGDAEKEIHQNVENLFNKLEDKIDEINNVTADVDGSFEILDMLSKADDIETRLQDLNKKEMTKVVFSANGIDPLSIDDHGKILKFNNLIMNVGQAYNLQKGRFTAPVAGIYSFHLVVRLECSDCEYNFDILAKGKIMVTLVVGDKVNRDQSSISVVEELPAGGTVSLALRNFRTKGARIAPLKDDMFSLFTGYLVHELY